jgi:hypothetical protein
MLTGLYLQMRYTYNCCYSNYNEPQDVCTGTSACIIVAVVCLEVEIKIYFVTIFLTGTCSKGISYSSGIGTGTALIPVAVPVVQFHQPYWYKVLVQDVRTP